MRQYAIIDAINNFEIERIQSNSGKNALKQFRRRLLSTGFFELHKIALTGEWQLSSSYGAYFIARHVKEEK